MEFSIRSFCSVCAIALCLNACSLLDSSDPPNPALPIIEAPKGVGKVDTAKTSYEKEIEDWTKIRSSAMLDELEPDLKNTKSESAKKGDKPLENKRRTLSVNAVNMQLSALLYALAADNQLQLALHEPMLQSVTLRAVDVSLDEILSRISMQTSLHWQVTHDVLHVWGKESYTETYPINYLNLQRTLTSRVGLATQVGTINSSENGSDGVANSSETRIQNIAEHSYWESLQTDVRTLLDGVGVPHSITINADAGFITLYGNGEAHAALSHYLDRLSVHSDRQVLIQASVIEVVLDDSFSAGVDWQIIGKGLSSVNALQALTTAPVLDADSIDRVPSPAGILSWVFQNEDLRLSTTLSLLEQFGDVRIVSRPQLLALNNQSAVLKVVDNRVYFTVNVERRTGENRDEVITQTDIKTVPVGLVMNVTPFIGENDLVMLNVRPTLSRILGFVNDPNPELAEANISNGVPEIQIREMESLLRIRSGETAVIGGLMQESTDDVETAIPFLSGLPVIGTLFKSYKKIRRKSELIILLHPTVSV